MYRTKIKAFAEIDSFSAEKQFEENVKKIIEGKSKEYILGVDEEEFKNYVISEYSVEELTIYKESEGINLQLKKKNLRTDFMEAINMKKKFIISLFAISFLAHLFFSKFVQVVGQ